MFTAANRLSGLTLGLVPLEQMQKLSSVVAYAGMAIDCVQEKQRWRSDWDSVSNWTVGEGIQENRALAI